MNSSGNNFRIANSYDRMREVRPFLDKIEINPQSKVLDVGAGNGLISAYFLGRGMTVTALDYDFPVGVEFDEQISKFECDFRKIPDLGHFDVVVLSHVLEHFSNPGQIITQVRQLLKPDGLIIVIVPRYTPLTTDGHWHTGWNVLQLGNFLTNGGFDCKESTFQKTGLSVCGFGKKMSFDNLDNESKMSMTLEHMPKLLDKFKVDEDLFESDFKYLDSKFAILDVGQNNIGLQDLSDGLSLTNFKSIESAWWEIYLTEKIESLSIAEKLHLIIFYRGEADIKVRLIVGFNNSIESDNDPYFSHADTWITIKSGLSVLDFSQTDFELRKGSFNWNEITSISLGGPGVKGDCAIRGAKLPINIRNFQ